MFSVDFSVTLYNRDTITIFVFINYFDILQNIFTTAGRWFFLRNIEFPIRYITRVKSIRSISRANFVFSFYSLRSLCRVLCTWKRHIQAVSSGRSIRSVSKRTPRWIPQSRSSRCKGSSLSAPGACQSVRQQINIWFPPCFLPIPMGDTYTWLRLIWVPPVLTPLLFRFFDARSAGTPALRVCPTSAVRQDAVSGLKGGKKPFMDIFFRETNELCCPFLMNTQWGN